MFGFLAQKVTVAGEESECCPSLGHLNVLRSFVYVIAVVVSYETVNPFLKMSNRWRKPQTKNRHLLTQTSHAIDACQFASVRVDRLPFASSFILPLKRHEKFGDDDQIGKRRVSWVEEKRRAFPLNNLYACACSFLFG